MTRSPERDKIPLPCPTKLRRTLAHRNTLFLPTPLYTRVTRRSALRPPSLTSPTRRQPVFDTSLAGGRQSTIGATLPLNESNGKLLNILLTTHKELVDRLNLPKGPLTVPTFVGTSTSIQSLPISVGQVHRPRSRLGVPLDKSPNFTAPIRPVLSHSTNRQESPLALLVRPTDSLCTYEPNTEFRDRVTDLTFRIRPLSLLPSTAVGVVPKLFTLT